MEPKPSKTSRSHKGASSRGKSVARGRPRIDPEAYYTDPVKARRVLMAVTAGIAVVVFGLFMLVWKHSLPSPSASTPAASVDQAAQARVIALERARYWDAQVTHAPAGWRDMMAFVRVSVENQSCQANPEVDGKLLALEQARKVAILRERQCLMLVRPSIVEGTQSPELAQFLDHIIIELGHQYLEGPSGAPQE